MTTKALIDEYNARISTNVIADLFKAMAWVKRGILALTAIIMLASYGHQVDFFVAHHGGVWAWVMPAPLDMLMILLMKISQLNGIPARSRRIARAILVVPALSSGAINFSGHGDLAIRIVFAGFVLAIAIGDYALSLIKPDFTEIEKAATKTGPVKVAVDVNRSEAAKRAAVTKKTNAALQAARKVETAERRRLARLNREAEKLTAGQLTATAPVSPAAYI